MPRAVQPSGSPRGLLLVALPFATLGCARGAGDETPVDARAMADAPRQDTADAAEVTADAPVTGCAIASGVSIALDGSDDLAKFPAAQQVTPGAMLGSDAAAIAWDKSNLYVAVTSNAFTAAYEPLHIYVETGTTLSAAVGAQGKEYSGLVPALPFMASQLVALRRVSDSGSGGAYDGVFVPSDGWMTRALALDDNTFVSVDHRTLSVRVPWTALGGCPTTMRLALHVVHGASANEWKDLVPSTHTPWQAPGGGYYEIDLTATPAIASWTLR